jgi:hypothetical protein
MDDLGAILNIACWRTRLKKWLLESHAGFLLVFSRYLSWSISPVGLYKRKSQGYFRDAYFDHINVNNDVVKRALSSFSILLFVCAKRLYMRGDSFYESQADSGMFVKCR